jgi:hypothetical protein
MYATHNLIKIALHSCILLTDFQILLLHQLYQLPLRLMQFRHLRRQPLYLPVLPDLQSSINPKTILSKPTHTYIHIYIPKKKQNNNKI